jgi:hypothetical protein
MPRLGYLDRNPEGIITATHDQTAACKGHQDRERAYHTLDQMAQLNVDANARAGQHQTLMVLHDQLS